MSAVPAKALMSSARSTLPVHAALIAIAMAALVVRCAYVYQQAASNPLSQRLTMDPLVHHQWAMQILTGKPPENLPDVLTGKPYFRAPLYYYLLAGVYAVAGPDVQTVRILQAFLGAVTVYLIGRLAWIVAGGGAAIAAAVLAALYWPMIYYEHELLSVGLENFLNVAMLLALLAATGRNWLRWSLLAGVLLGLSAITRPTVLPFAPLIVVWLWFARGRGGKAADWLRPSAAVALAAAAVIMPVTLRNYWVSGDFVLIAANGGVNFYIGNNPRSNGYSAIVPETRPDWWGGYLDTHAIAARETGRELSTSAVDAFWYGKAREWISGDPSGWLGLLWTKLRLFWTSVELANNQPIWFNAQQAPIARIFWIGFPVVAGLAAAGLVLRGGQRERWLLLELFFVASMLTTVLFFVSARYRLAAAPVLLVLGGAGMAGLLSALRSAPTSARVAAGALAAVLVGVIVWFNPPPGGRAAYLAYEKGEGYFNLATYQLAAAGNQKQPAEKALGLMQQAAELRPADLSIQMELAKLLLRLERSQDAIPHMQAVLAERPDLVNTRAQLAAALQAAGRTNDAIREYRQLVEADPNNLSAAATLGGLLGNAGAYDEAIARLNAVLERNENAGPTRFNLASLLRRAGRHSEALAVLRRGLELSPDDVRLQALLAWVLATAPQAELRNAAEALRLAQTVEERAGRSATAEVFDTLAAAQAEGGNFEAAVATARRARELALTSRRPDLAEQIAARITLYENEQPFRESLKSPESNPTSP